MYSETIEKLIGQFERLPGIGHKTAVRLAFFVLEDNTDFAKKMAATLVEAKEKVKLCTKCFNLAETAKCEICSNTKRDESVICVVESVKDVAAMEKTKEFKGLYHVLHGTISTINNVGAEDIRIKELIARLSDDKIKEVVIATNPTIEGETTAMYIARIIKTIPGIKVTRIAHGIPVGGDLEYTDEITLIKAMEGRREM